MTRVVAEDKSICNADKGKSKLPCTHMHADSGKLNVD